MLRFAKRWCVAGVQVLLVLMLGAYLLRARWEDEGDGHRTAEALRSHYDAWRQYSQVEGASEGGGGGGGGGIGDVANAKDKSAKGDIVKGSRYGALNVGESVQLGVLRTIPDFRHDRCQRKHSLGGLKASVILLHHNEEPTALFRSVVSVVDRTPPALLAEIIVVDDASDTDLSDLFDISDRAVRVKFVRSSERVGVADARTIGVRASTGEVVVFLDGHVEVGEGWLQPLVAHLTAHANDAVAPVLDAIDPATLAVTRSPLVVGAFGWDMQFQWRSRPRDPSDPSSPFLSPLLPGIFAIRRKQLDRLGGFDSGLLYWGGDNMELSFKLWMCGQGGKVVYHPCSRVAHMFMPHHPYLFPDGLASSYTRNILRIVEVWLDEYKQFFYGHRGTHFDGVEYGDIGPQLALKSRLHCKPFRWYLSHVFPQLTVPDEYSLAWGEVRAGGDCLDTMAHHAGEAVGVFGCHGMGGNQYWTLSSHGELMHDMLCLAAPTHGNDLQSRKPSLAQCSLDAKPPPEQRWSFRDGKLVHAATGLCLATVPQAEVMLKACADAQQQWAFSFVLAGRSQHGQAQS